MNNFAKFFSVFISLVMFFSTSVDAQSLRKFSMGLNAGHGTTKQGDGLAIGVDIRYQVGEQKQLTLPVTFGYTVIRNQIALDESGKSARQPSWDYFPLKVGIRYFLNRTGVGVYGLAEVGLGISVFKEIGFFSSTLYSPAIGYAWDTGLDIGAKYEHSAWGSHKSGYLGARLAYSF